ncbi:unnamed protein product [Caenorhabditis auriculariae]|uniref:Uncharacterized protein n=1 Tax=Caenorhabditis auriculariae TaxID=2777116 RepID=A0A8S1H2F1_9PELO|nr:unnamed protein product [Caenorhabditis auriculariae]
MIRSFVFAALVALALAASPRFERTFQPKNEYHYRFEGLVLAGLPTTSSEISQTRIDALARLQTVDDRTLALQLIKIRLSASHETEVEGIPSQNSLEKREIEPKHEELLELPVRAHIRNGLISDVQFDREDQEWSKNVKRAVLNMLQLNTEQHKDEKFETEQLESNDKHFNKMEKTIEGECEVSYTIVEESQKTIVTKSVNFDKCTTRPEAAYGLRFGSKCEQCEEQSKHIQPMTVYTYVIEKEQIQKVDVVSVYTINMNGQELMKTETRSRLTLEEVHSIKKQIQKVDGEKEEIIYSAQFEKQVEEFYKKGDKASVNPFEQYQTEKKIQQIKTITEQIMENEDNKQETAHHLARLVSLVRMCTVEELDQIHSEIYKKADKKVLSILDHVHAISGTKNTIEHLIKHIEQDDFSPIKAAQLLKSVQETPYPSEHIVEILLQLAKSKISRENEVIRQSSWLAIGSVVRGVVSQTPEIHLVKEHSRELKQKYVRVFMSLFNDAETTYEKILALKALGNAGIDVSVQELEKIIYDKRQPLPVRMEAIDALRLLKDQMPRKIQNILLPIYKNRQQTPELRMAAVWRIMQTLPEEPVLSQIVYQMDRESNQQVAAFTYRLLQSLSQSTNPCYKRVASNIQSILNFVRYQPQEGVLASFHQLPFFSEEALSGAQFDMAAIFGKNSVLPKELTASLDSVFGGNWNKYLVQMGFSQNNLDQIVMKALNKLQKMDSEKTVVRGRRVQSGISLLKKLAQKMNIRSRSSSEETQQPHAVFYLRYKEMDFAVLPIEVEQIERLVEKYVKNGKIETSSIERLFNQLPEFNNHHAAYFFDMTRKVPTSMGLPLAITVKLPTVFSVQGKLSVELMSLESRFTLEVQPSIAATHVTQMRFWTPLFEQGTKSLRSIRANVPVKMDARIILKKDVEVELSLTIPQDKKTTIQVSSRPVAFLRFPTSEEMNYVEAEEKTLVAPQWQRKTVEVERSYKLFGLEMTVRGNMLNQWTWENAALCEQDIEYTVESRRQEGRFTARLNIGKLQTSQMSEVEFNKVFEPEFKSEDSQFEERDENKRREHFNKMIRDIQSGSGYKHRLTFKLETPDEKYFNSELTTVLDKEVRVIKATLEARRSPSDSERKEWNLDSELLVALPEMPNTLRQLKDLPHREVQATIVSRWGSEKQNELKVNVQLEQSPEQKKWIHSIERESNGMPEYERLVKAARLNQISAVANYKLNRESEFVFGRLFNLVKAYSFWSTQERSQDNQENRVVLRLTVDPITRQYCNVSVQTPEQHVVISNAELPTRVYLPSIAQRSMRRALSEKVNAVCEVEQDQVTTFDNLIYQAPLTTCYSVIAKDCSEESQFAILAKKSNKKGDLLKVKIVKENDEIVLEQRNGEIKVEVNEKKVNKPSELSQYNIELINEKLAVIQLEDGEVQFDGYTLKTNMNQLSQGRLCGLCGNNDDNSDNEFRTAEDNETEDIEEFHRSFLLKDDECEVEESRLSEKKNYKVSKYENEQENSEQYETEEYKTESRKWRQEKSELVEKTKVVEYSHRVCFSLEPVKECRRGFEAEESQPKKVRFTCLPRHKAEARRLLNDAREKTLRLEGYPMSFVKSVEVPTACLAF